MRKETTFLKALLNGLIIFLIIPGAARGASQFDLVGPAGSGKFGTSVTVLPNGGFVITDVGTSAGDGVGSVFLLANGNYVVQSINWSGGRGAVTFGSGATGVTGAVAAANSLVHGHYRLTGAAAGETYILTARARDFLFAPQIVAVTDDLEGFEIAALP
ncbi:MAG: hypothetical protein JSS81_00075 [Acidobacteria bacterium]|nr:hypothetical protein [Acidobacteriota bacterium]